MNESEFIEENLYSKMFMKNERKGFKFCYILAIINYIGSVLSIPIIWTLLSMIFFGKGLLGNGEAFFDGEKRELSATSWISFTSDATDLNKPMNPFPFLLPGEMTFPERKSRCDFRSSAIHRPLSRFRFPAKPVHCSPGGAHIKE